MTSEREGDKVYVPTEPCHYGMIAIPAQSEAAPVPDHRSKAYAKRFEQLPIRPVTLGEIDQLA